jgi:hypothetical protein
VLLGATEVREISSGKMAIVRPQGTPLGGIILIPGSSTQQTISESGQPGSQDNFAIRVGRRLVAAGYAVAYVEDPSNLHAPIAAMRAIIRPVVLLGTSTGTIVELDNAVALGKDGPDALVFTSTVTVPNAYFTHAVTALQISRLRVPVLFVHNTNDQCKFSLLADAQNVAAADRDALFEQVTSDPAPAADQCGPRSPHGYLGIEQAVVDRIVDWIAGHANARADS